MSNTQFKSRWSAQKLRGVLETMGTGLGHKLTNWRLVNDGTTVMADCELCGEEGFVLMRLEHSTIFAVPHQKDCSNKLPRCTNSAPER